MRVLSRFVPLALLLATAPLVGQEAPAPASATPAKLSGADEVRLLQLGKTYTRWFLAGQADSLMTAFDPATIEKMGGIEGMRGAMGNIAERAGVEVKIVEEKMTYRKGQPQFWHAGEFSELAGDELVIRWLFTPEGKVVGVGINPKSQAPAPDPS